LTSQIEVGIVFQKGMESLALAFQGRDARAGFDNQGATREWHRKLLKSLKTDWTIAIRSLAMLGERINQANSVSLAPGGASGDSPLALMRGKIARRFKAAEF
jgi:hypothetical protein